MSKSKSKSKKRLRLRRWALLEEQFWHAWQFVQWTHMEDLAWIDSRQSLVEGFADFYEEYTYVVVASGFRGRTAARLTPRLVACRGNYEEMLSVFRHPKKCRALADVWGRHEQNSRLWADETRPRILRGGVDGLSGGAFPYIGAVTKFHLARNIGLSQHVAKPDVHLVRYAAEHGCASVQELVVRAARSAGMLPGMADFVLWVWLSHARGESEHRDCCHGGHRIR